MNLTPESKVLIQGFSEFISASHIAQMKAYNTNLIAGVNAGKGGQEIYELPVFDLVEEVVNNFGTIDTTIICVHPYQVLDAALEAIASHIPQIIITSAGVPPLDMVQLLRKTEHGETLIIGPNSPGIIVPGKILLGTQPSEFYTPGSIGIVSRSSTLTYEVAWELTKADLGQSLSVSIGSDAIVGSSFSQWLQILDEDDSTDAIVLIGQPGGSSEEAAAKYISEAIDKPVIAYIAGRNAPINQTWQNTGNLVSVIRNDSNFGTIESKLAAFTAANIPIAKNPHEIVELLTRTLDN